MPNAQRRQSLYSPDFRRVAHHFESLRGVVLDAPCGFGRHTLELATRKCRVTCVDIDGERLAALKAQVRSLAPPPVVEPDVRQHDLCSPEWPFPKASLAGAINVHYWQASLVERLTYSLQPHGLFYCETPENRGGNFHNLPTEAELRSLLTNYELLHYKVRPAGPPNYKRVTARLLAQKK